MLSEDLKTGLLLGWFAILFLVVAWVFVGMFTRHRDRPLCRLASEHRAWVVLLVLGLGLLFGTIGAYRAPPDTAVVQGQSWFGRFVDALYEGALQLTINGGVQPNDSVSKRMARIAGLAAIVLLAGEAIQLLFATPLQQLWLGRQKRHVVICGLGRIGRSIISDLTDAKPAPGTSTTANDSKSHQATPRPNKIVAIERDKANPDILWAESRGVSVVIGDSTDERVLMQVRADRAHDVFFAVGSDELNLENAYDLMCIVNRQRKRIPTHLPRMFVHLLNPRLESMLVQAKQRAFEPLDDMAKQLVKNLLVQPFNVIDRSIQALLDGPVLDRRPVRDDEVAHFVIVGFGEVGQELAVKIAQMAHYENLKRSRMTIVYSKDDEHAVEDFLALYPKFFPNLDRIAPELAAADIPPNNYDAWMPFKELDDWSFGVSITTKRVANPDDANNPLMMIDADASRGIEFAVNGGFELLSGGVTCERFIAKLKALSLTTGIRPLVFICHAEDDLNCADATELRNELDVRLKLAAGANQLAYIDGHEHRITILPYVPNRPMLHRLIDPPNKTSADLIPWGDCRESCTHGALTADIFRPLAVAINHDYDLKYAQQGARRDAVTPPARDSVPVKSLDAMLAWQRHSNLMAAAHVNTKLAPLGLALRPWVEGNVYPQPDSVRIESIINRSIHHQLHPDWLVQTEDDRLLEMVAKMEHHRWLAERLLMDWGFGDRAPEGSPENKKRLAFVNWANLLNSEGVKDRDQIARILELSREESNRPSAERRFVITSNNT